MCIQILKNHLGAPYEKKANASMEEALVKCKLLVICPKYKANLNQHTKARFTPCLCPIWVSVEQMECKRDYVCPIVPGGSVKGSTGILFSSIPMGTSNGGPEQDRNLV